MLEAIILAGGFGTRLRSVISDVPKPMAAVGGRPFLEILMKSLAKKGFQHIVLSVGYRSEHIVDHFGDRFAGIDIDYHVETQPLGTGGAIQASVPLCQADHVHILNGDTFLDVNVTELEAQWQVKHEPIIVARDVDDAERYGSLVLQGDCIRAFMEKGVSRPGLINAGWYVMPTRLLKLMTLQAPFSFEKDFLEPNVQVFKIYAHVTTDLFIDIGVPEDYRRSQEVLNYLL